MDIDISDILADVSQPSGQSPHLSTYDASAAYTDHIQLTRHWTTERCTPTLQSYPSILIDRILFRTRAQITRIEDLTSGVYESSFQDSHAQGNVPNNQNLNLTLSILQTDLSRTQFLIRSYLRQRLAKITRHAAYYLKHHADVKPDSSVRADSHETRTSELLSGDEIQFLVHHQQLLGQLYSSSFLSALPVGLRRLDDSTGGSARMDEGPDLEEGVFVRCLAAEWSNEEEVEEGLKGNGEGRKGEDDGKATVELRMDRGGVLVGGWRDVRTGVERGDLEVL